MPQRADYHRILELACALTTMRVALIGEVTDTAWRAVQALDRAGLGITGGLELDIDKTFCRDVRASGTAVWFGDHLMEPRLRDSPIPGMYGFRSYISVPIRLADGRLFGTLCTLDPEPQEVNQDIVDTMQGLAALVAQQMDEAAARALDAAHLKHLEGIEQSHTELLQVARQREEFIAVLAHDLRNPLQAIQVSADLLSSGTLTTAQQNLVRHVQDSADRMAELIAVTMDFSRGRLGSGIALRLEPWSDIASALAAASRDALSVYPGRILQLDFDLPGIFTCDGARLGQLLANLVINAAIHGDPDSPIQVSGQTTADGIALSVANRGMIPEDTRAHLFEPFSRVADKRLDSGLGLGLYIASQIALAHGGTLDVRSTREDGTVFTAHLKRV